MSRIWWLQHTDSLNLLVSIVTAFGVLAALWMIADCERDLRVAKKSFPNRVILARLNLRNELISGAAQVCLLVIAIVSMVMPPFLPGMQGILERDTWLADLLLSRIILRLLVSAALTIGALLNLRDRERLKPLRHRYGD